MTVSSIGEEKRHNPRLQVADRAAYIALMDSLALSDSGVEWNLIAGPWQWPRTTAPPIVLRLRLLVHIFCGTPDVTDPSPAKIASRSAFRGDSEMHDTYFWIIFFGAPLFLLLVTAFVFRPSARQQYREAKQVIFADERAAGRRDSS